MRRRELDRREFTRESVVALLSGAAVTVAGCGGGGGSPTAPSGPGPGPGTGEDAPDGLHAEISANHGHEAVLTSVEFRATGDVTLDIRGAADHPHVVDLTRDELDRIAQGERVAKESTSQQGHDHTVTFDATGALDPDIY